MPPGEATIAEELRDLEISDLIQDLEKQPVPALRQMARRWNWSLRGTSKQDIVAQVANYLLDGKQIAVMMECLEGDNAEILVCVALLRSFDIRALQRTVHAYIGRRIVQATLWSNLANLATDGYVFGSQEEGYWVPTIYFSQLPQLRAEKLMYHGSPEARLMPAFDFLQNVDTVLQRVDNAGLKLATLRRLSLDSPRQVEAIPSTLPEATLKEWGFETPEQQAMARFILETAGALRLLKVSDDAGNSVIETGKEKRNWEDADPVLQLSLLRQSAINPAKPPNKLWGSWNELADLLPALLPYKLQFDNSNLTFETLMKDIQKLRQRSLLILRALARDTWYDVQRLMGIFEAVIGDPLARNSYYESSRFYWKSDSGAFYNGLSGESWQQVYGKVIRALLTGPFYWLQIVELGMKDGQLVALRVPSQTVMGVLPAPPSNLLMFLDNNDILLRHSRWSGPLRHALRLIAERVVHRTEGSVYRPRATVLAETLQRGLHLSEIEAHFSAAGYPLSPSLQRQLQNWQALRGRHHLYDEVGLIEVNETMPVEQIEALLRQQDVVFYRLSPRHVLLLDPEDSERIAAELQKRGYLPRVLS